jgi:glycosyltransferase involved in cell wall biosynthesis
MAVCVSAAVAPLAVDRYNVRPDRVRVIHNGIRLDRFTSLPPEARAQLRQSLGLGNETPVLLLAGRMHPIKGHRAMLRMMPAIVRRCPDIVLLLAGDGPERGACEAMAGQLGIDRHLRFLGQRRDVPELLQACDVVVVPSESEGFCLVAVEAFATSRPVVAFDSGGVREVVEDGVTGWVVPAGGENAFVDAVVSLLLDARRRAEFGSRARLAAGQFGIEQHVQRLLDVYRELNGNTADRRIAVPVHGPGH